MTAFDSLKLHPNFFLIVPLIDISRSESTVGGTAVTLDNYLGIDKTLDMRTVRTVFMRKCLGLNNDSLVLTF